MSSPTHLPAIVGSIFMKPVTLPPGRLRLLMKPLPIGSVTCTKMIGMVRVCRTTAAVAGVVCAKMRSGFSSTSSAANIRNRSASPAAHR